MGSAFKVKRPGTQCRVGKSTTKLIEGSSSCLGCPRAKKTLSRLEGGFLFGINHYGLVIDDKRLRLKPSKTLGEGLKLLLNARDNRALVYFYRAR